MPMATKSRRALTGPVRTRIIWGGGAAALTAVLILLWSNLSSPAPPVSPTIAHTYAAGDAQFIRVMSSLLGPPMVSGNKVRTLLNGDQSFPAMVAAIRSARRSIDFESYIYWSGQVGREFADALSERARAGVPTHVLIDWAGSWIKSDRAVLDRMRAAGVKVVLYRPLRWYDLDRVNNRTHRKLLIVDGRIGFTGGIGVADQWLGHAQDKDHWRDTQFQVEGPVVAQLQAAFLDNWIESEGHVLEGEAYFPPSAPAGDELAQAFAARPAKGAPACGSCTCSRSPPRRVRSGSPTPTSCRTAWPWRCWWRRAAATSTSRSSCQARCWTRSWCGGRHARCGDRC